MFVIPWSTKPQREQIITTRDGIYRNVTSIDCRLSVNHPFKHLSSRTLLFYFFSRRYMQEIWEDRISMSYQENACIFTRDILMRTIKPCLSTKILRVGPSNHVKSESMIEILITWPENAKLESARPLVRKATISQGGSPRSTEDSIMKIAGETKAIVWHIFRTYIFKKHIQIFNSTFFSVS